MFILNKFFRSISVVLVLLPLNCTKTVSIQKESGMPYIFNRSPLISNPYAELPLGNIKPDGWLKEIMMSAAEGMTGNLDDLYPQVVGARNGWLGGDGDGWERGPYWLDGLLPLAYILEDKDLIEKTKPWIEWTLKSQTKDGYFGPIPFESEPESEAGIQKTPRRDWWPHMVMLKVLQTYYNATEDQRVIELMTNYFRYQLEHLPKTPLDNWTVWARNRGGENLASVYWLYNRTGEPFLLELGELLFKQTDPWTEWFLSGNPIAQSKSLGETEWSRIHVVNVAMAIKQPGVYYQQGKDEKYLTSIKKALSDLKEFHGQVQGMFSGDELLHGTNPMHGTELCAVVEFMFSLETLLGITGDVSYADHLEKIAFNALPTQISDDFSTRQYFQIPNQIRITRQERNFITPHDHTDICFGVLTGYPCCTTNLHQGWPKFVQNLWYATNDKGLAALIYAPSSVEAIVGSGVTVKVEEKTDYPFEEKIVFTLSPERDVMFPFHLRIPGWCEEATIKINGKDWNSYSGNQIIKIERKWQSGDVVELCLPMEIQKSRWHENSVGIERGPLVYALKMDENWKKVPASDKYGSYYEVSSTDPWNYGLIEQSMEDFNKSFKVIKSKTISSNPWNVENAPVKITGKAKRIEGWKEYNGMAGPPPWRQRFNDDLPSDEITLIPYGCTTLRISEFPAIRLKK